MRKPCSSSTARCAAGSLRTSRRMVAGAGTYSQARYWTSASGSSSLGTPPPARIPDRQREHAVHALGEIVSPFQVRAEHDLGVAAAGERMAPGPQLVAQRREVIRLAVEREGHPVADHRLVSGLEVEDRKPAVP